MEVMGNLFCCIQVEQSTVAIKENFGRFEEVLEPGCHCLPWFLGSQLAGHLSLRLQQLDVFLRGPIDLDNKNDIAKAVEDELEKVMRLGVKVNYCCQAIYQLGGNSAFTIGSRQCPVMVMRLYRH
ncbi:unnamed protein product [Thlaspi arvense]|uniref:Uncharacterized protein n=1 Tax=Thlaspi arvense TaxID=13288 RepID=A0AAU9RFW9_THLAR|nr:unnamed protein product [Thlaspi arvense]